ncbi:DUF5715 family protein [Edaphobacter albus]|uniref:DUF5715 family protein n=1 Tax=Edaphobacter sp. 4G125 TaxID=2763071 RepID=UPI0016443876|nr:DUF5715 family protein [Edaphobacter sp. 4G125]QNI37389.1 hypothetical protein H7846_03490 [Edaphobacter sp. 4G125]
MLWRSASSVFRMRSNVFTTVLLAVASLLLTPATLSATTRKVHHAARKTTASATSTGASSKRRKPQVKATTVNAHNRHKAKAVERTPVKSHRGKHVTEVRTVSSRETSKRHRKATSEDFVAAANAHAKTPKTSSSKALKSAPDSAPADSPKEIQSASSEQPSGTDSENVANEVSTPIILPTLYNKRGRLVVPPPLKGTREILVRQNVVADRDGLERIQDDNDLVRMREQHLLVSLPVSHALTVDDRLPGNRRYSRPWTAQFLSTLARAHYARFHTPLQVNSAVRTVEFQQRLMRTNGNAAPAEGETASPHLTGQAVDIAKHGLSLTEIAWLRGYLLPLIQQGRIDVEEEFQQACFHISVYKKYMPSTGAPRRSIASKRHGGTSALAAAID